MHRPLPRICVPVLFLVFAVSGWRLLQLPAVHADTRACNCDVEHNAAMAGHRECSLCIEANKQPGYQDVFFVKDANPTKPNRMLVLPRVHAAAGHDLAMLPPEVRHVLWAAAIQKAQEIWGDDWGIAYNGDERRTQCHTHLHIGKLLPGQENDKFVTVQGPADIPAPQDGSGLWVHPVDGKLHVHMGEQVNEFVLMR